MKQRPAVQQIVYEAGQTNKCNPSMVGELADWIYHLEGKLDYIAWLSEDSPGSLVAHHAKYKGD